MNLFEDELRKAMERHEPSQDFTARILASVQEDESKGPRSSRTLFWPSNWHAGHLRLAWAALLLIFVGFIGYHQHLRAVEGRAAKEQLLTAMHIAGAQLHAAQLRVKRIEFHEVKAQ
ncbi:MAG: hypothetical protein JO210_12070 [Acidobacteriaceae bacterium]|nr:hypothetical protein [Acidobacteriaceae bacterium]